MTGTVADIKLFVFATLYRASAITVKFINVQNVLIAIPTISLFNANVSR